jgi:hypothetical protein
MNRLSPSPLLRLALRADAIVSVAAGLAAFTAAGRLAEVTGASMPAVLAVAAFSLIYGLALGWLCTRLRLLVATVRGVVIGNFIWVAASVGVAAWLDPQAAGWVVLLGQAAVVLVLAELQWLGLRRSAVVRSPALNPASAMP